MSTPCPSPISIRVLIMILLALSSDFDITIGTLQVPSFPSGSNYQVLRKCPPSQREVMMLTALDSDGDQNNFSGKFTLNNSFYFLTYMLCMLLR